MQKIALTFFCLFLGIHLIHAQSNQEKHSIYFETAKSSLEENSQLILTELAQNLKEYADYSIDIQAHTDDQGDTEYNNRLANDRANSVQNFLLTQSITVDNLTASAFGESNPEFDNKEETGRRLNRRVDIYIKTLASANFSEIQKQWQNDLEQRFSVDGQKRTQVFGKDGTKLWLEANTFVFSNGAVPTEEIDLRLTECFSFGNMLLADLSTTSGDKLLQTGGMMKIEAYVNGEELVIAEGKSIQAATPTQEFDKDMQLFYGEEHPENDRLEDWQLADNAISASAQNDFTKPRYAPYMGPNQPSKPTALIYTVDSTFMPKKPVQPEVRRFRPVTFPDTMSVYTQKAKSGIFTSKSKLEEERKAKVQKIMTRYEKRLARLAYNKESYAKSLVKYEKEVSDYPVKLKEWDKEVKRKEAKFYASENYKSLSDSREKWYQKDLARYKKARADYKILRKKRAEDFEKEIEQKGNISAATMNYYFFQVNRAGWINCDKFSQSTERELLVVNENKKTQASAVYAIFPDMNSIIRLDRNSLGEIDTKRFPRGQKVMVLGWQVQNGQPMMAKTETIMGNKNAVYLNYRKVRLQELRETLAGI